MVNTIGQKFSITSFGSSHGKAIGAVVDGCPANLPLSEEDIQIELNKRRPGTSSVTTPRNESDQVQILSGIFEGKTDGTPIAGVVFNKDQHSKDYSMFKDTPNLKVIYVGPDWTGTSSGISTDMFTNCGVSEVTLKP